MATSRRKDPSAPYPADGWNEIAPHLWMGGHFRLPEDGSTGGLRPTVVGREFDLVVSMYMREGHGPATGVRELDGRMPDGPLSGAQLGRVRELAEETAAVVRDRRPVLVRCHYGYNRSGLVVGAALVLLGRTPEEAVALIRRRRSPWALHNKLFVEYLTTGLDIAELLSGLDEPA